MVPVKRAVKCLLGMRDDSLSGKILSRAITFFLVMLGWIVFRAPNLKTGMNMISSIFTVYNPWILFDDSLLKLSLDWKEWMLLIGAIYTLFRIEYLQEKVPIRDAILRQPLLVRWCIYVLGLTVVIVFGKFGYGFSAADFIYGGF